MGTEPFSIESPPRGKSLRRGKGSVPISARLLAGITIVVWSFAALMVKLFSTDARFLPLGLTFALSLTACGAYHIASYPRSWWHRLARLRVLHFAFGQLGYFGYTVPLVQCFRSFDTASTPTVLNYTWPVFTVLFTNAIRRRLRSGYARRVEAAGVLLGFAAVAVVATDGRLAGALQMNAGGVLWGLLAGMSYGVFSAFSSTVPRRSNSAFLVASTLTSLAIVAPLSAMEWRHGAAISGAGLAAALYYGAVANGLGYITWTRANRLANEQGIPIASIASLMFVLPITSLMIVSLALGEREFLRPHFALAVLLVTAGSELCRRSERTAPRR